MKATSILLQKRGGIIKIPTNGYKKTTHPSAERVVRVLLSERALCERGNAYI